MANGAILPVIAGLATGIAFIVLISLTDFETPIVHYTSGLIDDINPRFGIDDADRKRAVDIMLQNATVTDLLEGRDVFISGITGVMNCGFYDCVRIHIWQRNDSGAFVGQQVQVLVDYSNQRVTDIRHTDGW